MFTRRKRSNSRSGTRKSIYLWEFLFGLLEDEECSSVIAWTNKREGIFELKNTEELAKLWGTVKNRPRMDKSKLIRAIRTYYERGMLKKVKGHKGVYQFLSIPYETQQHEQEITTGDKCNSSTFVSSSEHNLTNCSAIAPYCRNTTAEIRKSTENNRERFVESTEETEVSRYRSRSKRWSEYSVSSDSSTKSLDDLNFPNADLPDHKDENMDFVFN